MLAAGVRSREAKTITQKINQRHARLAAASALLAIDLQLDVARLDHDSACPSARSVKTSASSSRYTLDA
jgi:hypothetical protein